MPTHRHDVGLLIAIGRRLRTAREAKGLTQAELAEAIRIEPETLSRYENGVRGASLTVLARSAKVLGTTLADLMPASTMEPQHEVRPGVARVVHLLGSLDEHDLALAVRVIEAIAKS